jgi:hypothetical protein
MKIESLKQRLDSPRERLRQRNRPMTSVTIRMPEDVVEDLKKVVVQQLAELLDVKKVPYFLDRRNIDWG